MGLGQPWPHSVAASVAVVSRRPHGGLNAGFQLSHPLRARREACHKIVSNQEFLEHLSQVLWFFTREECVLRALDCLRNLQM